MISSDKIYHNLYRLHGPSHGTRLCLTVFASGICILIGASHKASFLSKWACSCGRVCTRMVTTHAHWSCFYRSLACNTDMKWFRTVSNEMVPLCVNTSSPSIVPLTTHHTSRTRRNHSGMKNLGRNDIWSLHKLSATLQGQFNDEFLGSYYTNSASS